jgi:hypothetical protein
MADESKTDTPVTQEEFRTTTGQESRLDRTAERAAEKAGQTEKRYDRDHDIFTK